MIGTASRAFIPVVTKRKILYRSYKNFNEDDYVNDLFHAPFSLCEMFDDIDDKLWVHNKILTDVIDHHAPVKTKFVKGKPAPFMNNELRRAINAKAMLRRRHQREKSREAWNKYVAQRKKVNKLKRQSIKIYFDRHCNNMNDDSVNFWKTVKPYFTNSSRSSNQCITLFNENRIENDQRIVANLLNEYFVNIADHLSEDVDVSTLTIEELNNKYMNHPSVLGIKQFMNKKNLCNFNICAVTTEQLFKKFKNLNVKKACGYDSIPPRLLRAGALVLCTSFKPIVNYGIANNVFPSELKCAVVSPIHKKNDVLDKGNYRPVSVLSSLSKVFESVICDQVQMYLDNVLSEDLSAYRKHYGCENVLFKCLEEWKFALDNNETAACIAMDLSKAFDCLPHGLLLTKMSAYGMSNNCCTFFQSYLVSRNQRVKIGSNASSWLVVKRGVPQGSLTGPMLFNLFLNDLLYTVKQNCSIFNYADDNTLSFHHKDVQCVKQTLQLQAEYAINWFKLNFMEANASKFQAMVMSRNANCNIEFLVNGVSIPCTDSIKLLGVEFDSQLTFDVHVSSLCKKAGKRLNAMYRLRDLSEESMKRIFDAFIRSSFNYCMNIWHLCSKKSERKVEKLQERALRCIYKDYSSDYETLLDRSNRIKLYDIRTKNLAVSVYKILNGSMKPVSENFYRFKSNNFGLRNSSTLERSVVNTTKYGINSLRYQGAKIWDKMLKK